MMLTHSFDSPEAGAEIEKAVATVLDKGYRSADIHSEGTVKVSTEAMGDLVLKELQ
jgi:3-isopropylmalate dehydrogenase